MGHKIQVLENAVVVVVVVALVMKMIMMTTMLKYSTKCHDVPRVYSDYTIGSLTFQHRMTGFRLGIARDFMEILDTLLLCS
jgi:hypothetical protein